MHIIENWKIFDTEKALNILLFIAWDNNTKTGEINYIKALNLFFLSYKLYLKQYWIPLLNDSFNATADGIIAKRLSNIVLGKDIENELLEEIKEYLRFNKNTKNIKVLKKTNLDFLSVLERKTIETVLKTFKKETPLNLLKIVKNLNEWKDNKKNEKNDIDAFAIFGTSVNEPKIFKTPKKIINTSILNYFEHQKNKKS